LKYVYPIIVDYGSIADHTFTRAGGCGSKKGSCEVRVKDTKCEHSHTSGVDQCPGGTSAECTCAPTCPESEINTCI
jgi:hypothetical protein